MRVENRGPLAVRVVGGDRASADAPLIVLLHGFGAPGDDLVPLWRAIEASPDVRWAFPAAPLTMPGPDFGAQARAWWMLDVLAIEEAMMSGEPLDPAREVPEGLAEARGALLATLDALEAAYSPRRIVLGGFSQGAMLALDAALHSERSLAGLVLMSGSLVAQEEWEPRMPARAGLPVFLSHGMRDPLLSFAAAERLRDRLASAGLDVAWTPFRGGHEIPPDVLHGAAAFLSRVL